MPHTELATRSGLTQAKISRIEGSDTIPTLHPPAKLAKGLDASLSFAIEPEDVQLSVTANDGA